MIFQKKKRVSAKEKKERIEKKKIIGLSIIGIFLILFALFTDHGVINRFDLEIKQKEFLAKINAQKKIADSLNRNIMILEKDTSEIERIAREKYGMIHEGERVFFIELEN